jgi:hypothetical protein
VEHKRHRHVASDSDLSEAASYVVKSFTPAFAAMTGHKQMWIVSARPRRPLWDMFEQSVDTGIARNDNLAGRSLAAEICSIQLSGSEQQVRSRIDSNTKILLGPRISSIMAA